MSFQPPDPPEPDYDALWESWFDQQEKNGYAVLSRDEWKSRLNEAATDAYAEGRSDQREDDMRLLNWAYSKLQHMHFAKQEDALAMDEIKLMQWGVA
jgi:hypothetical protein